VPVIHVFNSNGNTDVVVDLIGVYDDGTLGGGVVFHPITPTRIADSRIHLGLSSALGANATGTITTPGGIVTANTAALSANVTAVLPTKSTFLTVWPFGDTRPTASTVNAAAGAIVPNAAIVALGTSNKFNVYNLAGTTNVLVDVSGTFEIPANIVPASVSGLAAGTAAAAPHTVSAVR
jgi:hypothetical protein